MINDNLVMGFGLFVMMCGFWGVVLLPESRESNLTSPYIIFPSIAELCQIT